DVGLAPNSEDVNAIQWLPDSTLPGGGRLLLSTVGSFAVGNFTGGGEDVLMFTPTQLGETTAGSWDFYFDGSDIGLDDLPNETIAGLGMGPSGELYLSF